jgi:hypothetical protein
MRACRKTAATSGVASVRMSQSLSDKRMRASLSCIEFAQQRPPFHVAAGIPGKIVELLLQQEGKEGAEDMAADGGVR